MAEKEYIEREVLLEFLQNTYDIPLESWMARNYWSKVVEIKQKFIYCIGKIPAADVAEVVRCKDCKHYHNFGKTSLLVNGVNQKAGWCQRRIRYDEEHRMLPTDFCSYGVINTPTNS